jgi:ATP-dependent DNA helicase DinG
MSDYIEETFGEGGYFAQAFANYEARSGQVKVARAVDVAVREGQNLLAEAPTGTGKSVAYGVPASWWAAKQNDERSAMGAPRRKVVIVTANIALQEQIVGKDLPLLQRLLPWKFSFALLKGMQNFLCKDRFEETAPDRITVTDPIERRQLERTEQWARETRSGDLSELPFELTPRIRQLVVIGQDECTGKSCAHHRECFGRQAKKKAEDVDIVVTNYHMFFLNLRLRDETEGMAGTIPEHEVVVFDEAHKAPDIARDFFGFRITRGQVRNALRLLDADATPKKAELRIDRKLKAEAMQLADDFFRELARYSRSDKYDTRLREMNPVQSKELRDALRSTAGKYDSYSSGARLDPARKHELGSASAKCREIARSIEAAMGCVDTHKGHVYFIEAGESDSYGRLVMKPLSVADELREKLFDSAHVRAVAMTSATLTASGRFDFIATELGCETAEELVAESPFDWGEQCLLVQPQTLAGGRSMPLPTHTSFADEVARGMVDVAEMSGGRMLGLFTSYRVMERAHRMFLECGWDGRVMKQGEQPRTQLVQRLKDEDGAVLLGVESFWAGIDVPGQALSVVAIDRLPFPNPDDPLLDAFEQIRRGRGFKDYSMPRAVIALRQGFGRLIRTTTDRGVVVVFDRRLAEKGFGRSFLKSLPPGVRMSRNIHDVRNFLSDHEAPTRDPDGGGQ